MIRGVPYDHQLEYIESTGSQWIDTGFTPDLTKDFSVDCTAGWVTNNRGMLLSSYTSSGGLNNVSLELYDRKRWRSYVLGNRSIISYGGELGELAHLSFSYAASTGVAITALNGTSSSSTVPSAGRIVNTRTAILGSDQLHRYPYGRYGRMRIYNPGLACDLIPVSVNGVAMMYDRVTGTFPKRYGTFVAGPVASTPLMGVHMYPQVYTAVDCVHNGLVGLYDAIENVGWGRHSTFEWKNLKGGLPDLTLNGCTINTRSVTIEAGGYATTPVISTAPYVSVDDVKAIRYGDSGFTSEGTIEFVYKSDFSPVTLVSGFNETSIGAGDSRNYWKCFNGSTWSYFTTPHSYPPPVDGEIHKVTVVYGPYDFRQYVDGMLTYSNSAYAKYGFFNDTIILGKSRYGSTSANSWEAYTLRIYTRKLTNDERALNDRIDYRRFNTAKGF